MATQSPLHLFEGIFQSLATQLQPPPWAVDEAQRRIVLLLNHVLMREPAAMDRLTRQKGAVLLVQWRSFYMRFLITPAGLLDLAPMDARADLSLTATDESVTTIAQSFARGEKPAIRIEGDVQLAADVNWLVDHVRWDIEEDLARIVGDAPAHALGTVARRMAKVLQQFAGRTPAAPRDVGGAAS